MNVPQHIAIILDGNGRWAKAKGMPRNYGHAQGSKNVEKICEAAYKMGVKYLTVYAFSTENWRRPKDEVSGIMNLMRSYLKNMVKAKNEHIAVRFIGSRENIEPDLLALMEEAETADVGEVITTVQVAFNYGGRDEIVHAARQLVQKGEEITEESISANLYSGVPEADLILRPSGEERLSNFLLWESAYAEFVFMDVLWPDFTAADFDKALDEFAKRSRRFGGV